MIGPLTFSNTKRILNIVVPCSVDCFHILDHAPTTFQRTIKEAFQIQREQPSLNQQLHYVNPGAIVGDGDRKY